MGAERWVARSEQLILALLIHLEGDETALKRLFCELVPPSFVHREKIGNACDGHTLLRRTPPGVACEPILPTPAVMGTHGTRRARRRGRFV